MLLYLITYDIPCNKRRKKVSDILEGYGTRVQYSVFECVLPTAKYTELKKRLKTKINPTEDSIRLYPLSSHTLCKVEAWGGTPITTKFESVVV